MRIKLSGISAVAVFFLAGLAVSAALAAFARSASLVAEQKFDVPFVENMGQWPDSGAAFGARIMGGGAWVMSDGRLVYAAVNPESGRVAVFHESLLNAAPSVPRGIVPSETRVHFFTGVSGRWRSGVAAFSGADMGEVYPGILLELRAGARNVEKVFRVSPGAEPGRIRVEVEGAAALRVCAGGELALETAEGELRFTAPVAWQEQPSGGRLPVEAAYAVDGMSYGFSLGAFDPTLPLVIDPLFASTFVGGKSDDLLQGMATDSEGNVYITGYTWSLDFPSAGAPPQPAQAGNTDVFVAKLNASLKQLLAATYLGGSNYDGGVDIIFDTNAACVYVAGEAGAGFPVTAGAFCTNFHAGSDWWKGDAFVARLSADLSTLQAATYLGGAGSDVAKRVKLRPSNAGVAVAGWTCSPDFPATAGAYDTTYNSGASGAADVFVALFNPTLSSLQAATYLGAAGYEEPAGLDVDASGNVFVAGYTLSRYFPTTSGAYRTNWYQNPNMYDGFISKFSPALNALSASTFFGGVNDDYINAALLDPYDGIIVAGQTDSGDLPVQQWLSYDWYLDGPSDAFLARLDTSLSTLYAATYLGGSDSETATALALDPLSFVYVGGMTRSLAGAAEHFPVSAAAYQTNLTADGFIAKLNLGLSALNASTLFGAPSNTLCAALAVSGTNRVLTAGSTDSDAFPTTAGAYSRSRQGSNDCFVAIFDAELSMGDASLAAPGSLAAGQNVSALGIPVSWSAAPGALGYTLWRARGQPSLGSAAPIAYTSATSYNDTSVQEEYFRYGDRYYYYWVSAHHPSGQSRLTGPALGILHTPAYKDYDGDGCSDLAVFDTYSGSWYVLSAAGALIVWAEPWGWPGAWPVAGDFDGDALSDFAVYDFNTGSWYIRAKTGAVLAWPLYTNPGGVPHGLSDFNGEPDRAAVFYSNYGQWMIADLSSPDHPQWVNFGWAGAWPVWCGSDLAVFDTSTGYWFICSEFGDTIVAWAVPWGWPGAWPLSGDYDGDGRYDLAVFDTNTGHWYIRAVEERVIAWQVAWGWPGAWPIAGDYDGDGRYDLAVFDTNTGHWYIRAVEERVIAWQVAWGWPGAWPVGVF